MSRCGKTQLLEPMVAGEVAPAVERELRTHAATCPVCHHELNWLDTESRLFRERASREEVALLWKEVAQKTALPARRAWGRVLMTAAASMLLVLTAGRVGLTSVQRSGHGVESVTDELLESSALASLDVEPDSACSRLPEGLGFHCAPVVPASFVALRDR
jgi:hypothetical protein